MKAKDQSGVCVLVFVCLIKNHPHVGDYSGIGVRRGIAITFSTRGINTSFSKYCSNTINCRTLTA